MDLRVDSDDLFHGLPIAALNDGEVVARLVEEKPHRRIHILAAATIFICHHIVI